MNVTEIKAVYRHICEQADEEYIDLVDNMVEANSIPPFLLPFLMEVSDHETSTLGIA